MTRPVLDKMGFRAGVKTQLRRVPPELLVMFEPALAAVGEPARWRSGFVVDAEAIDEASRELATAYRVGEFLWFCYPKKSGPIRTDISRDHGWEPIAELDLLAVAQISIDQTWSALRFRFRSEIANLTRGAAGAKSPLS